MSKSQQEIEKLIQKLFAGTITEEELVELNAWYDTLHLQEELEIAEDQRKVQERIWQRIQEGKRPGSGNNFKDSSYRLPGFFRVAAAIALLVSLSIGLLYHTNILNLSNESLIYIEKVNLAGQRSKLLLPDSTLVWLNSESSIKYPEHFSTNSREITVIGEAYFEVVPNPNKPFRVHSEEITTTVVGTSFNVQAYPGESVTVTVAEGKVEVAQSSSGSTGNKKVVLHPSQQAVYLPAAENIETREVDVSVFIAWKEDILRFEELPLKEVIRRLERWYGVNITLTNKLLGECVVVGSYQQKSLENILKAFSFALNIEYEVNQNQVIIRGGGCGSQ